MFMACTQLQHSAGESAREDGGAESSAIERHARDAGPSAGRETDGGADRLAAVDAATPHHGNVHASVDAGQGSGTSAAGNDAGAAAVDAGNPSPDLLPCPGDRQRSDYHLDWDQDGFGDVTSSVSACDMPAGYVTDARDCDDSKAEVNPDAAETCNGLDDDCDRAVDEGFSCVLGALGRACTQCGLMGSESCDDTCSYGGCRGFVLDPRVYGGAESSFSHDCGVLCDPAENDWCVDEGHTANGCFFLRDGPGLDLPPGRYEVELYWADGPGAFDFSVLVGGAMAAVMNDVPGDPAAAGNHLTIPFAISASGPACSSVTLSIYAQPKSRMRMYDMTFRRLGE